MTKVTYKIVQHDGGWAYMLDDVFSEPFASHDHALKAARMVALEQQVGGATAEIAFQGESGEWHYEHADGGDRPEVNVIG